MVVEDEAAVRDLVVRSLQRNGYNVIHACDGRSALELFRQHEGAVDLVLSDVVMPELSGPDLIRALRERQPDLRALFMTGYTDDEVFRRGLQDTEMGVLHKPFGPGMLAEAVRRALDS